MDTVSSWRTTILKEKPGGLVYALYANSSSARPQGEIVTGAGAGHDLALGSGAGGVGVQRVDQAAGLLLQDGGAPGADRVHLDPPGDHLRQRLAAPLPQR